jgi:hypothetical protein
MSKYIKAHKIWDFVWSTNENRFNRVHKSLICQRSNKSKGYKWDLSISWCSLVSWSSRKQILVFLSTVKAEYVAARNYCMQLFWMVQSL